MFFKFIDSLLILQMFLGFATMLTTALKLTKTEKKKRKKKTNNLPFTTFRRGKKKVLKASMCRRCCSSDPNLSLSDLLLHFHVCVVHTEYTRRLATMCGFSRTADASNNTRVQEKHRWTSTHAHSKCLFLRDPLFV